MDNLLYYVVGLCSYRERQPNVKAIPPIVAFGPDAAVVEVHDIFCDGQAQAIASAAASHAVHPIEAFKDLPALVRREFCSFGRDGEQAVFPALSFQGYIHLSSFCRVFSGVIKENSRDPPEFLFNALDS